MNFTLEINKPNSERQNTDFKVLLDLLGGYAAEYADDHITVTNGRYTFKIGVSLERLFHTTNLMIDSEGRPVVEPGPSLTLSSASCTKSGATYRTSDPLGMQYRLKFAGPKARDGIEFVFSDSELHSARVISMLALAN